MEVIVSLEDRTTFELTDELSRRFGKSLTRAREGAVNPDAPACSPSFGTKIIRRDLSLHEPPISPLNFGFILPHDLLSRTHLKNK